MTGPAVAARRARIASAQGQRAEPPPGAVASRRCTSSAPCPTWRWRSIRRRSPSWMPLPDRPPCLRGPSPPAHLSCRQRAAHRRRPRVGERVGRDGARWWPSSTAAWTRRTPSWPTRSSPRRASPLAAGPAPSGDCPNGQNTQIGSGAGVPCQYDPVCLQFTARTSPGIAAGNGDRHGGGLLRRREGRRAHRRPGLPQLCRRTACRSSSRSRARARSPATSARGSSSCTRCGPSTPSPRPT